MARSQAERKPSGWSRSSMRQQVSSRGFDLSPFRPSEMRVCLPSRQGSRQVGREKKDAKKPPREACFQWAPRSGRGETRTEVYTGGVYVSTFRPFETPVFLPCVYHFLRYSARKTKDFIDRPPMSHYTAQATVILGGDLQSICRCTPTDHAHLPMIGKRLAEKSVIV